MDIDTDIKYCIVAFLDLQGFSAHLEVSSDLRTTIGRKAIERLDILENSLQTLKEEAEKTPKFFPDKWEYKRINDSIIFTVDLSPALLPNIGDTIKDAMTESEWGNYYGIGEEDVESFDEKYFEKRKEYTASLVKFIGLISRAHQLVNIEERNRHFPGAKTVVSTGFRRVYKTSDGNEDPFSANFAFSNAYTAQDKLKGANLFLDNNIIQMLDGDLYIQNIAKLSCLKHNYIVYSPLRLSHNAQKEWMESNVIEISLFHKKYFFRQVNPNPLTYLQFIDVLEKRQDVFQFIIDNIKQIDIDKKIKNEDNFNILKIPYDLGKDLCNVRKKK